MKRGCGIVVVNKEGKLLLGLRGKKTDDRNWGFVGGSIEQGETPLQGAIRELKEVSGLDAIDMTFVDVRIDGNEEDYLYVCSKFTGILVIQPEEIAEFKWVTFEEAEAMDLYGPTRETLNVLKERFKWN